MPVLLKFTTSKDSNMIKITRISGNYKEDDIEMIYSSLAMRFARELIESHNIIAQDSIESVDACIAFSRDKDEANNVFLQDIAFEDAPEFNKPPQGIANIINFRLMVESTNTIGGMASPTFVMANTIYNKMLEFAETQ